MLILVNIIYSNLLITFFLLITFPYASKSGELERGKAIMGVQVQRAMKKCTKRQNEEWKN